MTVYSSKHAFLAVLWSAACVLTTPASAQDGSRPTYTVKHVMGIPMSIDLDEVADMMGYNKRQKEAEAEKLRAMPRSEALEELKRLWAKHKEAPSPRPLSFSAVIEVMKAMEKSLTKELGIIVINVHTDTDVARVAKLAHLDKETRQKILGKVIPQMETDAPAANTEFSTPKQRLLIHNFGGEAPKNIFGMSTNGAALIALAHEVAGHGTSEWMRMLDELNRRMGPRPMPKDMLSMYHPTMNEYVFTTRAEVEADITAMYVYAALTGDNKGLIQLAIARVQDVRNAPVTSVHERGLLIAPYVDAIKDIMANPVPAADMRRFSLKPLLMRARAVLQTSALNTAKMKELDALINEDITAIIGPHRYTSPDKRYFIPGNPFPDSCGFYPYPHSNCGVQAQPR